jgi:type I restriction enzyme, S subunit
MKAAQLLTHFRRISEAPDAIPRLRRFILELAVRGKLVEQDPRDEPASELLKRIEREKEHLVITGGIKKEKPLPPLSGDDILFPLPMQWTWSQLAEVGFINPRNSADDTASASFIPMALIASDYGIPSKHEVRFWRDIKNGFTHFADGDVVLAKITPCFQNGKSTVLRHLTGGIGAGTTELHVVRPIFLNPDFVLIFLKSPHFIETGIPLMTGTAGQKRVSTQYFANSPFPLPPLAEQHRIVAKVDELMALCDRLEATQAERESRRDRLAAATLNRLNQPANDSSAFQDHARFYFNHLPRLTTRLEHIQRLRQTILNLAVRGQLVSQDLTDQPASELLKRIQADKARLVKEGAVRKRNPTSLGETDARNDLPMTWRWELLGNVITQMDSGWSPECEPKPRVSKTDWGILKTTAVQKLSFDDRQHKALPSKLKPRPEYEANAGDILITRAGPKNRVGICCLVEVIEKRLMISDKIIRFHLFSGLEPRFIALALNAGYSLQAIENSKSGMAVMQMNISQEKLKAVPIPIPPLAEQHRIVDKVQEVLALCDRLEAQLSIAQTESRRLLEAVLHDALSQHQKLKEITPVLGKAKQE